MLDPNILISLKSLLFLLSINIYYFISCSFKFIFFYLILSFPLINWKLSNTNTKQSPYGNRHSDFRVFTTWTFGTLAKWLVIVVVIATTITTIPPPLPLPPQLAFVITTTITPSLLYLPKLEAETHQGGHGQSGLLDFACRL